MKYRWATENDVVEILLKLKRLIDSSTLKYFPSDISRIKTILTKLITMPRDESLVWLAEDEKGIQGFIICTTTEFTYSNDTVAVELALWVEQSKISGIILKTLLEDYHEWAEAVGASFYQCSSLQGKYSYKFRKFLKKLGFTKIEETFLKKV